MDYIIQAGDTPSKLAKRFVNKEGRWPEFCKANPQFKSHATYGCVFYVGNKAKIPDSWVTVDPTTGQAMPAAAAATATSTATGPTVETPVGPATEQQIVASESGGTSKIVLIGAGVLAVLVVGAYAMKKKAQAA
jgi:hypothetical protein